MLACQHQERPSVQNLIKTITHDFIIRCAEPSTKKGSIDSETLTKAADAVEELIQVAEDGELVARVAAKVQQRVDQKNEAYDQLVRSHCVVCFLREAMS
jgi:proteasome activator subunit 4